MSQLLAARECPVDVRNKPQKCSEPVVQVRVSPHQFVCHGTERGAGEEVRVS